MKSLERQQETMADINENKLGYKQTKVGWVPEEWEVKKLENLGKWKGGGTPSKYNRNYWRNGNIPWVSPKDMKSSIVKITEDYITEEALKNSSITLIPANSILIVTRSGILRRMLPVAWNLVDVAINQDLKALIPDSKVDNTFIFHCFEGNNSKILFHCAKDGTTVESVDFSALKKYEIPLPPLPEQKKIAAILYPKIDFLTEKGAEKSRPCKKGSLTIVCSGEVGTPAFLGVDACIHDGFLAIVDLKNEKIEDDFLYNQIFKLKGRLERGATHGGVFTNLTTTILKEFEIPLPNLPEQRRITAVLSTCDEEIATLELEKERLAVQKKGLMQQLLTGAVRVNA